jgi:hypothetical protein
MVKLTILAGAAAATAMADASLPVLNKIQTHQFSTAYSCGGDYDKSALAVGPVTTSPDFMFNGACGADPYFDASFGGADFALLSRVGSAAQAPLENVSAHAAFNYLDVAGQGNTFNDSVFAQPHTTYAVLRTQSPTNGKTGSVRTLFAFEVGVVSCSKLLPQPGVPACCAWPPSSRLRTDDERLAFLTTSLRPSANQCLLLTSCQSCR